jgi:hypothetical protein
MFDVYTTMGDMAHVDTILKFLPHTRQHAPILTRVWQEIEYRIDVYRVTRGAHMNISSCQKKPFQFSCGCEQFH